MATLAETKEIMDYPLLGHPEDNTCLSLDFTLVESAIRAEENQQLLEWQIGFLAGGRGKNTGLAERLAAERADIEGIEFVNLNRTLRIIGPEPEMPLDEDAGDFRANVERCKREIEGGQAPGPLLAVFNSSWERPYYLVDGNHTKEALKELGLNSWWITVVKAPETAIRQFPVAE